ncbi:MAG: FAD/NAD(P)-binding protein [Isosphaeraceae bacterium]
MNVRMDPAAGLPTVAIIGCGFSGAMVAVHLSRLGSRSPRVLIFERGNRLARGAAYGTVRPEHLLNVPARLMSAFADEPDHFVDWLRERDPAVQPGAFVPRRVYGDYLENLLQDAMSRPDSKLTTIQAEVVDLIDETSGRTTLVTNAGARFGADAVVVAVGNPGPQDLDKVPDSMRASGKYVSNPWVDDPFRGLKENDPIIMIGSGLTAVDLLVEAESRKVAGKITAVSRHGLTPLPHKQAAATTPPNLSSVSPPTSRNMLRSLRMAVQQVEENGGDWRSVMDSLRGSVQELWKSLGEGEKRRFLRHLAVYWDVHRHRVAPEIHSVIDSATSAGRFAVIAGRIKSMIEDEHGVQVVVNRRGSPSCEILRARRVINCTGPSRDLHVGFPSLIGALCKRGLGRSAPLGLGLQAGADAALIGGCGARSKRIFAIGPLLKGELWETTAVRELRVQAADLARHLASTLEVSSRMTLPGPERNLASGLAWTLGTSPANPPAHPRSAT